MKRIHNLKKWLLINQLVEESEYLQKYLDLLSLNLNTIPIKSITQAHHAIPVCYYKQQSNNKLSTRSRGIYDRIAAEDSNNCLVNLKYTDHLLAHCYLALCAKPIWFKFANANMVTAVSKYTTLEEFASLKDLTIYQEAYTLSCQLKQGKTLTEEHKAKIAASHNRSEAYSKKISEANRNRIWTEESRAKLSKSLKSSKAFQMSLCMRNKLNPPGKGLVWVFNGEHLTRVSPGKLSEYFAAGYWLGKTTTIQIRKNSTEIEIHAKEWPKYEIQGWKQGWKLSKRKQNINKEEI